MFFLGNLSLNNNNDCFSKSKDFENYLFLKTLCTKKFSLLQCLL